MGIRFEVVLELFNMIFFGLQLEQVGDLPVVILGVINRVQLLLVLVLEENVAIRLELKVLVKFFSYPSAKLLVRVQLDESIDHF